MTNSQKSQAEYDCRYTRTESYLTAQLLQGLHGYCSGNKRLFELSESFRNNLIHHAKCMGLFRQRPDNDPGGILGRSAEERWSDWIHQERLCRLGWAVYVRKTLFLAEQLSHANAFSTCLEI